MTVLRELPIIQAPFQRFETSLMAQAVSFTLEFNTFTGRWSFGLEVAGAAVLAGRRLVPGVDLLAPFNLGLGKLFLVDWEANGAEPGRSELPSGKYRLLHLEETA